MPSTFAGIESTEALREALLALRREHDALTQSSAQAQQLLDALESLLALDSSEDPFAGVFASLHKVFSFSQAMMLAERDGPASDGEPALECIVADPQTLVGSVWPIGALFRKVIGGRVVATFSNADLSEWRDAEALGLSAGQSALYLPVGVRERRGILVLLRQLGDAGFDRGHVTLARRFAVLASHALATRFASQSAAEGRRLRELTEQLQQSEQLARRNASLLQEVVNVLPIGVAVQDEEGRLLLVNDAIAVALDTSAQKLIGQVPFDLRSDGRENSERRRRQYREHLSSGVQHSRERSVTIGSREHTLLITGKPVRIHDELLMLSASLDITERKRFEEELAYRAFHDPLTGLPNRALMHEIVDAALKVHRGSTGGRFALAFIDLDNFKQVNDYYSHAIGDALLRAVALRIGQSIRGGDTLARISGDEFLLLIDPLDSEAALPPLINRVTQALKQPFVIEGHELTSSASIGASIYPLHGDSYEALRRNADSAMYRAKSHRKGSVSYFNLAMGNALTARMDLEQRLRVAIRERHFRVALQPKVRLADGQVMGFEALIRWVDPDGSVRMPGEFIEIATELGLLDDITRFALDEVVGEMPRLLARYGDHIRVSINVAARQAGDLPFMQGFAEALAASGLADRIVLELTEDALVAAQRFQQQVLPRLRELGVRVSIDDFGTGYSSLSTLSDITADEIKVDRAFITAIQERPRSQGILKAIESLCAALGIEVVAEGVETPEELAYLRTRTRIPLAQGYHFARPLFAEQLPERRKLP